MMVSLGDQQLGARGCLVGPAGGLDRRLDCDTGAGCLAPDDDDTSSVQPNCQQYWRGLMIPWPGTSFLTWPDPGHFKACQRYVVQRLEQETGCMVISALTRQLI